MNQDTVLTPLEVAEILKISKNTVYELIKRGELNAYRVGNKVRVDLSDVEEYKNNTKTIKSKESVTTSNPPTNNNLYISSHMQQSNGFVICGQDIMLDILSRHLERHPDGVQALRSYVGSYDGLYSLYHNKTQIATAHLWDGETNEYNIPYVKRLLPGIPSIIINLASRYQGFYVAKGNPKNIKDWNDLTRTDLTFANREKGSGSRILLDEHLKLLHINSLNISGYTRELSSHLAVASTIARGGADFGLGNEKFALQVNGIDFIPLQKERYDLVMKKEDFNKPPFKAIMEILNSEEFKLELAGIGGYDLSELGSVIYET